VALAIAASEWDEDGFVVEMRKSNTHLASTLDS